MKKILAAIFAALFIAGPADAGYTCQVRAAGKKYSACNQVTRTMVMQGAKCLPSTNPQMCGGKCTPTVASDCNPTSCVPTCVTQQECSATCNSATQYRDIATNTCKNILMISSSDFGRCMKCTNKADMINCVGNPSLSC